MLENRCDCTHLILAQKRCVRIDLDEAYGHLRGGGDETLIRKSTRELSARYLAQAIIVDEPGSNHRAFVGYIQNMHCCRFESGG